VPKPPLTPKKGLQVFYVMHLGSSKGVSRPAWITDCTGWLCNLWVMCDVDDRAGFCLQQRRIKYDKGGEWGTWHFVEDEK
jgi:hypothetical protein